MIAGLGCEFGLGWVYLAGLGVDLLWCRFGVFRVVGFAY